MRFAGALATTMLFATACGGGSQLPSDPVEALTSASQRLDEQGPFDVTLESTTSELGNDGSFVLSGEGMVDVGAKRGRLTMTGEASHPVGEVEGGSCELIYDGSTLYGRVPEISEEFGSEFGVDPSAEWLRAPLGDDDEVILSTGISGSVVDQLRSVSDEVEIVGTESVGGVRTTHYRATVSLDEPPDGDAGGGVAMGDPEFFEEPPVIHAWIDDGGLPRRMATQATAQGVSYDTSLELSPHEGPFDVSAPPADATSPVDRTDLIYAACFSGMSSGSAPGGSTTDSSRRAAERAAQSSLRNAITAAKAIHTDNETYEDATPEELDAVEPFLTFVASESTGPRTVSVRIVGPDEFRAAALADSGTCFAIRDDIREGTTFAQGTVDACTADAFPPAAYTNTWTS